MSKVKIPNAVANPKSMVSLPVALVFNLGRLWKVLIIA